MVAAAGDVSRRRGQRGIDCARSADPAGYLEVPVDCAIIAEHHRLWDGTENEKIRKSDMAELSGAIDI